MSNVETQLSMPGRRAVLKGAVTGALWLAAGWRSAAEKADIVTTGAHDPALDSFDQTMMEFMRKRDIPGGALAVAKEGRLVYARGYGYADRERQEPVQPDALFRIASISKPFTSVAILTLVQSPRHRLDLDTPAFSLLKLEPHLEPGAQVDPRLREITVRQLLHHTGGFDRDRSFDPMFRSIEIANVVGEKPPAGPRAIVRYMMGRPLDFDPGARFAYSNFGYCVLGRLIEAISGLPYEEYVQRFVLQPMGIHKMRQGRTRLADRAPGEVRYYQPNEPPARSVFPEDQGQRVDECYGGFYLEAMDSHGAWLASAPSLIRFVSELDFPQGPPLLSTKMATVLNEPPAPPVTVQGGAYYGCGWSVRPVGHAGKSNRWHNGSLPGTNTLLVRRWDGLAWAALFNQRETGNGLSDGEIDAKLHPAADAVKEWPTHDLFVR